MPYHVGEKGSYGCSGYPVIKTGTSDVMGCHDSAEAAQSQIAAIESNEKVSIKNPEEWPTKRAETDSNGMGSRMGQPHPASTSQSVFRKPKSGQRRNGGDTGSEGGAISAAAMPDIDWDYEIEDIELMEKQESYSPNDGMKSAARRAIKWKEDGKSKGAGTAVGWGRARDIVAGRSMSLSVVKRMYSFFSRHEVDKKGEGFYSGPNFPSKGRVMWDAWGGDAGFSWSRAIVRRNEEKALFADFGKDYTRSESITELFKGVGVGSMVSWNSSGGIARGKITRIIRSGTYKVPGTDVSLNASAEDPVAVIRLYRNGEPTDTVVAHKLKTLRVS